MCDATMKEKVTNHEATLKSNLLENYQATTGNQSTNLLEWQ